MNSQSMLIPLITFCVLGVWYLAAQVESAEAMADLIEQAASWAVRRLRSHAAGKRAALASYRIEYRLRWNQPHARRLETEFWDGVVAGLHGDGITKTASGRYPAQAWQTVSATDEQA